MAIGTRTARVIGAGASVVAAAAAVSRVVVVLVAKHEALLAASCRRGTAHVSACMRRMAPLFFLFIILLQSRRNAHTPMGAKCRHIKRGKKLKKTPVRLPVLAAC